MKTEIRRQIFHSIAGTIAIAIVLYFGRINAMILAGIVFLAGLIISLLVLRGFKIPVIEHTLKYFGRESESALPGKGALMFALGIFLILILFQRTEIIVGAFMVATYGDAASAIVGKTIGKTKIWENYTLEGTIGGIVVATIPLLFLFPIHVSVITATLGMLAELLPIDDNIGIPHIAAAVLTVLF